MKYPGPSSLTYCTNVHPLGDFAAWTRVMGAFGPAIRAGLGWPRLPMGMWFPSAFVDEIAQDPAGFRGRLKARLAELQLSTFTFNAFPYGNFHDAVVKTKVYSPDWTDPRRLAYTVACARLLADLLPDGPEGSHGSVSTLPLGWRAGWTDAMTRRAAENLCAFAAEARRLADATGKAIRLGIEPEPGCVLETTEQAVAFWEGALRPAAAAAGLPAADLDAHVGLCYDTCHQAVQFEDPVWALDRLAGAGIPIAKMQLSSALIFHADPERASAALRREFCEPRFLHQTRIAIPGGVIGFDDLPEALDSASAELWARPWRVHFHVPIDAAGLLDPARIATTRDDMVKAYCHARARGLCRHFEVETYTWSVMPEAHRPADDAALAECIARELRFVEGLEPAAGAAPGGAAEGRHA